MQLQADQEGKKAVSLLIPSIILVGVCLVIAFGLNYADILARKGIGSNLRTSSAVSIMPFTWICCGVTVPLFIWLSRLFKFSGWKRGINLAIHIIVVIALSYGVGIIYFSMIIPMDLESPMKTRMITSNLFVISLPFWLMITGIAIIRNQINARQRRIESERLKSQLAEARLNVMNLQLQPHFLFNTMQGISTLMYTDVEAADKTLHGLSDFLRYVLTKGTQHEVTVEEELDSLSYYLDICEVRFGERFNFIKNIDAKVLNAKVPFLLLQPLVENIFKHVVEKERKQVDISLTISIEGNKLYVLLTDNGIGMPQAPVHGTGLSTLTQRLYQLYEEQHKLDIVNNSVGGVSIHIHIPLNRDEQ